MTYDVLVKIRQRFRALLIDPKVNSRRPKCRSVAELCAFWARKARGTDEVVPIFTRERALVRSAIEVYRPYTMADVRQRAARKAFVVCSLFSGAGGSCLGYQLAGGDVRLVVEFSPSAAGSYRRNNRYTVVERRDIRSILATEDGVETALWRVGLRPGDLDLLDASPPCTEFSLGGAGIGDQSKPKVSIGVGVGPPIGIQKGHPPELIL